MPCSARALKFPDDAWPATATSEKAADSKKKGAFSSKAAFKAARSLRRSSG
jgi:hypothetical protein